MKKRSLVIMMVWFSLSFALAQRTVSGTVTDVADNNPLVGASVIIEGTTQGTTTDLDGKYSFSIPATEQTLVFSFTGYTSTTKQVASGATNVEVNVTLAAGVELANVIITGLGIPKAEKALTYSAQQVNASELTGANETNMVSALSAKVAGLQVTNSAGVAGASSFMTLRGASTISGSNQPLIVIDGVPVDNQQLRSGESSVGSVAFSNRAIDINQSEIESISVLKGASATAIYGSLAGNGAIIVTTKRAKANQGNKLSVEYSTTFGVSQVSQLPAMQNKYSQGRAGAFGGPDTGEPLSWGAPISDLVYTGAYAWDVNGKPTLKAAGVTGNPVNAYDRYKFYRQGSNSAHNLAISNANKFNSMRLSMGYSTEEGIVPNNTFSKINIGLNTDSKLTDKLNVGVSVQYVRSGGTRIEQGSNVSGVMLGLLRTPATFDNSNGTDSWTDSKAYLFADGRQRTYRGYGVYDNPYWTANNNPLNDDVNRVFGNLNFSFKPTKWLTIAYRPGIDYYSDTREQYFAVNSAGSRVSATESGRIDYDQFKVFRFNGDLTAIGDFKLTNDLNLNVLAGQNMRAFSTSRLRIKGDVLVIPNFYHLSNAKSFAPTYNLDRGRNMGYFGKAEFAWKNMLYVEGTGRMESDISLPESVNPYFYYSAGAGFVFSELPGLKDNKILSYGKVRASYGKVGLGTFSYSTATYYTKFSGGDGWTPGLVFPFKGVAGFTKQNTLGNDQLRPEIKKSLELGAQFKFFKNRLGIDISYYDSKSEDIILSVPVAAASGYSNWIQNAASLSNKGLEVVLNMTPVKTKDFSWDVDVNYTKNTNLVEQLAPGVAQVFLGGFTGSSVRAVTGQPYSTIFGYGFLTDASGATVIGANGFPILDSREKAFSSAQPKFTVGIRNELKYKGLSLSALLDIKEGGVMWNGTRSAMYYFGTHQETADLRNTKSVFPGNVAVVDAAGSPILNADGTAQTSGANTKEVTIDQSWLAFGNGNGFFGSNTSGFIESTSWVRLRDITLSYQLPLALIQKARLTGASISLSGRNQFLKTPYKGVDPETSLLGASNAQGLDYFNMPGSKSWVMALKLTF